MPITPAGKYLQKFAPPKNPRSPALPIPGQLPLPVPGSGPGQYPGPNKPPLRWLEELYLAYNDLYEAVRRLERISHHNQTSQQVGGAVIANPPGPGNPPDKKGPPPPPGFPP